MTAAAIDPQMAAQFEAQAGFPLAEHLILLGVMGSRSQNTALTDMDSLTPPDLDVIGVVMPPARYVVGLGRWESFRYQSEELDATLYSFEKTVSMCLKGNPNIAPLLWLREQDYMVRTPEGAALVNARDDFSSRRTATAFVGFATGQMHRMVALTPQMLTDYADAVTVISGQVSIADVMACPPSELAAKVAAWGVPREAVDTARQLHKAHGLGAVGDKRKAIVATHGFDVKNASHTVRSLRMVHEFLQTGRMQVYRTTDAAELRAIKSGQWSIEQVAAEVERMRGLVTEVTPTAVVPEHPNLAAVEALVMRMQMHRLGVPGMLSEAPVVAAPAVAEPPPPAPVIPVRVPDPAPWVPVPPTAAYPRRTSPKRGIGR